LSTFAPGAELARLLRHTDTQVLLMGRSIAGHDLVARVADALPGLGDGDSAIALAAVPYLRRVHVWPDSDRAWATPWPGSTGAVAALTDSAEQEVGPADDLVLVTTSGTTALPKSVAHTHGSLVRHAAILARHRGVTSTDRIYSPMPFFWVRGHPRARRIRAGQHAGAVGAGTCDVHLLLGSGEPGHGRPSRLRQA
jgi:acyl-CoA synthetase (AMP-forming)/AMP-acid ligase II